MAEKEQQRNSYSHGVDSEAAAAAAAHDAREQQKTKRTERFLYIVLLLIFQTTIITAFALTVMKLKTPKFRIHAATITALTAGAPATPSLHATVTPEFSVKNTNFGGYEYRDTAVDFFYRGAKIGHVIVQSSKAGWRSTKRFIPAAVELNVSGSPQLAADLSGGVVPITSSAEMRGRMELIFIMRKNKSTNMNCTMEVVTATHNIRNISCK